MSRLPSGRAEIRRDLALLAFGSAALFVLFLGARDLWNPNEPIYGQGVAEMTARRDWVVPTVNGKVFAEKPILYYWMALAASRLLGRVDEFTLRLPSALAGIAAVLLLYLLVVPYAGRDRARIASILLATTFGIYWGARSVQMDILVTAAALAVVVALTRVVDDSLSPWRGWLLAGLAAGAGFLAKGPVAWICPGIVVLSYLVVTRRLRAIVTPAFAAGAALCLGVSASWFALLVVRGETGVIAEVLFRQNVTRFVDPWDHQAPWWYYLEYFWIDLAPWAWFVPLAIKVPDRDGEERKLDLLAWLWIAGVILFFTLSKSKRSPYILPVAPAVAIVVSGLAERLLGGRIEKWRSRACLALLAACGAVAVGAGIFLPVRVLPSYPDLWPQGKALAVLLVAGGSVVVGGLAVRRRLVVVATAFLSLVVSFYLLASVSILPAVDSHKSARGFCDRLNAIVPEDADLASFRFWDWRAAYTYYAHRPIRNLASIDALREYWERSAPAFLVVEETRLDEARAVLGSREPLVRAGVGSNTAYLFSNGVRNRFRSGNGS